MARLLLDDALLLDPEGPNPPVRGSLLVENGQIVDRLAAHPRIDAARYDLGGRALAPGFVDLHVHGSFVLGPPDRLDAAFAAAADQVRHGTTAYLVTTLAWPAPELAERVGGLVAACERAPVGGAAPLGIHLEGPWINPAAAGAQPALGIRPGDASELDSILEHAAGRVRLVTLAPEVPGAAELQARLTASGIVTALGHSLANADQVDAAVGRGATHVTHLFNAMGALHHREPGLAGAALADERLTCDLICDGAHVDPRMVWTAARALGERLILITDRIDAPQDGAVLGNTSLCDDGVAWRLPDGRLAGSQLTLDRALSNVRSFARLSLVEAVAACTLRPARALGVESERGTLRRGARADLVVLDEDGGVCETWLGGTRVFERDESEPGADGETRRTAT